jgi:hypothetical protein
MPDIVQVQQKVSRNAGTFASSFTTDALASSPTIGNLLTTYLWVAGSGGDHALVTLSGWSDITPKYLKADGGWTVGLYYRVVTGSEGTQQTWSWEAGNPFVVVNSWVQEWANADTTTPIDAANGTWTDLVFAGGTQNIPSVTTVTDRALHVGLMDVQDTSGYGPCTGYTEEVDMNSLGAYSKVITPAGATGTVACPIPTH